MGAFLFHDESEGFRCDLSHFSKPKPMSRRKRLKQNRWQAQSWRMTKRMRLNPIGSIDSVTDPETGLTMMVTTLEGGQKLAEFIYGQSTGLESKRIIANNS